MLGVAVILAFLMAFLRRDAAYLLTLIWAFVAIAIGQSGEPQISMAAWVSAGLVLLGVVIAYVLKPHRGMLRTAR
jgi:hypothetical protein